MTSKFFLASVTFWLNLLGVASAIATQFVDVYGAQYPKVAAVFSMLLFVINIIRRQYDPTKPLSVRRR